MFNQYVQWLYVPFFTLHSPHSPSAPAQCQTPYCCTPCTEYQSAYLSDPIHAQPFQTHDAVPSANESALELQFDESESVPRKRRYRKRRTDLKKDYECCFKNCRVLFSSRTALVNHLRLKHDVRKRYNKKQASD